LQETELNSEQLGFLKVLRSSGKALFNIINDILDFSRIEAGRFDLDYQTVNLISLLDETISIFHLRAKEKSIHLDFQIQSEFLSPVLVDPVRLQQILINLLGNALKFTQAGEIELIVKKKESQDWIEFSVRDTGIGIPEHKLESIFESFTQVDSSTTRRFGGTGLGLSISKKITELMGGKIWAESKEGEGSQFFFVIPYQESEISKTGTEQATLILPPPDVFPKTKLLIAEDSPENVFLLKSFFRKYPIELVVVSNGAEAVQEICEKEQSFDAAIMDMQMPVMDGLEATKAIRIWEGSQGKKRSLPIIALTANVLKEDIQKSFQAGCSSYLTKPVLKDDLLRMIYFYNQETLDQGN